MKMLELFLLGFGLSIAFLVCFLYFLGSAREMEEDIYRREDNDR